MNPATALVAGIVGAVGGVWLGWRIRDSSRPPVVRCGARRMTHGTARDEWVAIQQEVTFEANLAAWKVELSSRLLDAMHAGAIDNGQTYGQIADRLTAALLPMLAQERADALREFADFLEESMSPPSLRARADDIEREARACAICDHPAEAHEGSRCWSCMDDSHKDADAGADAFTDADLGRETRA